MNKTVAKLAAKAGFDVGIHDGMILGNFSDIYKCQKLAEIIINECINAAGSNPYVSAKTLIKEHFGIEND